VDGLNTSEYQCIRLPRSGSGITGAPHTISNSADSNPGVLTHHPPRTASGRPATPEASRTVVPVGDRRVCQAPTRHHLAGTKPLVYNQGCKRFCKQEIPVTTAKSRSEPLYPHSNFSFATRRETQEIPCADTVGNLPARSDVGTTSSRRPFPQSAAQANPGTIRPTARREPLSSELGTTRRLDMCMGYTMNEQ